MSSENNIRITIVFVIFAFISGGIIFRLFSLQVSGADYYRELASKQHFLVSSITPKRGEIYLQNGKEVLPLAVNKELNLVYAVPAEIKEVDNEMIVRLAEILKMDAAIVKERLLKKDDPFEPLKNGVEKEAAEIISSLGIPGIYFKKETSRFYPAGNFASHLVGFLGFRGDKRAGQYGLEGYYEKELAGQAGSLVRERDSAGKMLAVGEKQLYNSSDGADLILTIEESIQFMAEEKLKEAIDRWQAERGTVIIIDPASGAVRAMANYPSFNPNQYAETKDLKIFSNSAISDIFEPGSVFKPITMAAGINEGIIGPETTYEDKGFVNVGIHRINNFDGRARGTQTMTQVLEQSLNTGAVFVAEKLGKKNFKKYVEQFGFSQTTGIDLTGEARGDITNLLYDRDIDYATASFGQGIAVTPIALLAAVSALANDGILMRPYVVGKMIFSDGREVATEPRKIRRVISPETASRLAAMMTSVVDNGYDRRAAVTGYSIAGKTGTAQIPDSDQGGYKKEEFIHTFVGFGPVNHPRFAILIKIDKPRGAIFASNTLSTIFGDIAEFLVRYYNIPPDREE